MAVLANLGDEQLRRPAIRLAEGGDGMAHALDLVLVLRRCRIDALHRARHRRMAVEHLLERQRDFAHRRLGARGIDGGGEQVALA